jgi:MSHA biogenesis protein MshJ
LGVLAMVWMTFVHDALVAAQTEAARAITIADGRIAEELNNQADIKNTYTTDPNSFALSRQLELREATGSAKMRLDQLYGELITPQQMSQMLTTILRRETTLKFVSLQNQPSEALVSAAPEGQADPGVQVFKHGMRMEFEGNFLETIRYLRSLEQLDGNFFWENLEFNLGTYPNGRISLDIYTLSTEQGWIGV